MAKTGYGGSYDFPNVDFSWLGELPQQAETARLRGVRQSLGDLGSAGPGDLEKASATLIQGGDLEGAKILLGAANAQRATAQRGANDELTRQILGRLGGIPLPAGVTSSTPSTFTYDPSGGQEPAAAAPAAPARGGTVGPAPLPFPTSAAETPVQVAGSDQWFGPDRYKRPSPPLPTVPTPLAPTAPLTGSAPPLPPVTPGQRLGAPTPPEAPPGAAPEDPTRIASALAPLPPAQLGPQTAQVGPMTQTPFVPSAEPPAPTPTVPGGPGGFTGTPGFDPRTAMPVIPQGAPGAAPAAPRPLVNLPTSAVDHSAIQAALDSLHKQIVEASAGGRGRVPPSLIAAFTHTMALSNPTPEERNYQTDQLQNEILGLPRQTRQDWKNENTDYPARAADFRSKYNDYRTGGIAAREAVDTIQSLQQIVNNDKFQSGYGTETFSKIVSGLSGVRQGLIAAGVDPAILPDISRIRDTNVLQEAFDSIKSQAVFRSLGGLGAGRSEGDRRYVDRIQGTLSQSTEGIQLINEYNLARAKQAEGAWHAAEDYAAKFGPSRSNVVGMDRYVQKYLDDHPLLAEGSDLRKRMDVAVKNARGEGSAVAPAVEKVKEKAKTAAENIQEAVGQAAADFNKAGAGLTGASEKAGEYGRAARQWILDNIFTPSGPPLSPGRNPNYVPPAPEPTPAPPPPVAAPPVPPPAAPPVPAAGPAPGRFPGLPPGAILSRSSRGRWGYRLPGNPTVVPLE